MNRRGKKEEEKKRWKKKMENTFKKNGNSSLEVFEKNIKEKLRLFPYGAGKKG